MADGPHSPFYSVPESQAMGSTPAGAPYKPLAAAWVNSGGGRQAGFGLGSLKLSLAFSRREGRAGGKLVGR